MGVHGDAAAGSVVGVFETGEHRIVGLVIQHAHELPYRIVRVDGVDSVTKRLSDQPPGGVVLIGDHQLVRAVRHLHQPSGAVVEIVKHVAVLVGALGPASGGIVLEGQEDVLGADGRIVDPHETLGAGIIRESRRALGAGGRGEPADGIVRVGEVVRAERVGDVLGGNLSTSVVSVGDRFAPPIGPGRQVPVAIVLKVLVTAVLVGHACDVPLVVMRILDGIAAGIVDREKLVVRTAVAEVGRVAHWVARGQQIARVVVEELCGQTGWAGHPGQVSLDVVGEVHSFAKWVFDHRGPPPTIEPSGRGVAEGVEGGCLAGRAVGVAERLLATSDVLAGKPAEFVVGELHLESAGPGDRGQVVVQERPDARKVGVGGRLTVRARHGQQVFA